MNAIWRVVGAGFLVVIFGYASHYAWIPLLASIVLGVLAILATKLQANRLSEACFRYTAQVAKAMDRLLAALCGFDGSNTISYEFALRRSEHKVYYYACKCIDFFEPGHSDRQIR